MRTKRTRPGRGWQRRPAVSALTLLAAAVVSGCSTTQPASAPVAPPVTGSCDATSVADTVVPSVVTISASNGTVTATGSGEVIRDTGEIMTNNHVIALAANGGPINVLFSDGTAAPATLTGRDPQTDLAVIKANAGKALPVMAMGTSGTVKVGQPVVAVGAPLGLAGTVTSGIVSALGRTVELPADDGHTTVLLSAIQTDAAINPGNSGGALTDCSGKLIGVPTAIATVANEAGQSSAGSVGLGFAIPVDLAKAVTDELIATGAVTHSYLGVQVIELPPSTADGSTTPGGLYVNAVDAGGPAAIAGLQPGDVITAIDGQPVDDADQLAVITLARKPGETVAITYERAGTAADVTITLGVPPAT